MVRAVRGGEAQRSVGRRYAVPLSTVQYWLDRAGARPLDQVDWSDRPPGAHPAHNRTPLDLEDRVLQLRRELREESDLGEYGAVAIQRALGQAPTGPVPHVRTLHRILERHGALDEKRRRRHPPPPPGWYLPAVARGMAELDQCDLVEGLKIKAGPVVEVFNVVSVHGGLVGSWPQAGITAQKVRTALVEHWRAWGLPAYAQFDNDTVFQGPHQHPDAIGSVIRLCLSLAVVPVFAPPRETGFQAAIESYNGRWQAKVWVRFTHASLTALCTQSAKYVTAYRHRTVVRREAAPERRPFPPAWTLDLHAPPQGQIVFLRRATALGQVRLLGRTFEVSPTWPYRLVRCEVLLNHNLIRFYALRRRAPTEQRLLAEVPYVWPQPPFPK